MELDLKNAEEFTLDGVKKLIASRDDSTDCQLCVTKSGIAYLSSITGQELLEGEHDIYFRFETWGAGNDYVGIAASQDEKLMMRLYKALKKNWPARTAVYIDLF